MLNCILIQNIQVISHPTVKKSVPSVQLIYLSCFSNNSPKDNNKERYSGELLLCGT